MDKIVQSRNGINHINIIKFLREFNLKEYKYTIN